ncbi:MAG: hypothetical protein NUV45_06425 [Tepidanaerobacteraceae bacterium]|jgi:hypothetical protein|nr:hypothetical protein [Tepidanaerobacteraceae bacterium]
MTCGIGFIAGNRVYLGADMRITELQPDGSNGQYNDGSCKITQLSDKILMFCGGVIQATQPFKAKFLREFGGKSILDQKDLDRITQLCRQEYDSFMQKVDDSLKNSPWLKDFVLSVIIAENSDLGPRLIRFDIEDDFKPGIQSNEGAVCIKSAITPEILWPEVERIADKMQKSGFFDPIKFINRIFKRASEMDKSISAAHNIFVIPPAARISSYAVQKITAGKITATIQIESPIINGSIINGGTITGSLIRTDKDGYNRIEISNDGLFSYDSSNRWHGLVIDIGEGVNALGFFYHGDMVGTIAAIDSTLSVYPTAGGNLTLGSSSGTTYTHGDWCFNDNIGFFGNTPVSQQSAQLLPSSATLSQVIIKINGILDKLGKYGLFYVYD